MPISDSRFIIKILIYLGKLSKMLSVDTMTSFFVIWYSLLFVDDVALFRGRVSNSPPVIYYHKINYYK